MARRQPLSARAGRFRLAQMLQRRDDRGARRSHRCTRAFLVAIELRFATASASPRVQEEVRSAGGMVRFRVLTH